MKLENFPNAQFRLGFTSGMDVFSQILAYKGINHEAKDVLEYLNTESSTNISLIDIANSLIEKNIGINFFMDLSPKLINNNNILNVFDVLDVIVSEIKEEDQHNYMQSLLFLNRKSNIQFKNITEEFIDKQLDAGKAVILSLNANSFLEYKYPDFHEKTFVLVGKENDSFVFRDKRDFRVPIKKTIESVKKAKNSYLMVV